MIPSHRSAPSLTPIETNAKIVLVGMSNQATPLTAEPRASSAEGKRLRVRVKDGDMDKADDIDFYDTLAIDDDKNDVRNSFVNTWVDGGTSEDHERDENTRMPMRNVIENIEQDRFITGLDKDISELSIIKQNDQQIEENRNGLQLENLKDNKAEGSNKHIAADYGADDRVDLEADTHQSEEAGSINGGCWNDQEGVHDSFRRGEDLCLKDSENQDTKASIYFKNQTDVNRNNGDFDKNENTDTAGSNISVEFSNQNKLPVQSQSERIATPEHASYLDREDSVETSYFASFKDKELSNKTDVMTNEDHSESRRGQDLKQSENSVVKRSENSDVKRSENSDARYSVYDKSKSSQSTKDNNENEESYDTDLSVFTEHTKESNVGLESEIPTLDPAQRKMSNSSIFLKDVLTENNKTMAGSDSDSIIHQNKNETIEGNDEDNKEKEDGLNIKVEAINETSDNNLLIDKSHGVFKTLVAKDEQVTLEGILEEDSLGHPDQSLVNNTEEIRNENNQFLPNLIPGTENESEETTDEAIDLPEMYGSGFISEPDEQSILRVFISTNGEEAEDAGIPYDILSIPARRSPYEADLSPKSSWKRSRSSRRSKSAMHSNKNNKKHASSPHTSSMASFQYGGDNTAIQRLKKGPYAEVFKRDVPKVQQKPKNTKENLRKNRISDGPNSQRKIKNGVSGERGTEQVKDKENKITLRKTEATGKAAPNIGEETTLEISENKHHDPENDRIQYDVSSPENLTVDESECAINTNMNNVESSEILSIEKSARGESEKAQAESALNEVPTVNQSQDAPTTGEQVEPPSVPTSESDKQPDNDTAPTTTPNESKVTFEPPETSIVKPDYIKDEQRNDPASNIKPENTETNDLKTKAHVQKEKNPSIREWSAKKKIIITSPKTSAKMTDKTKEANESVKKKPKVKTSETSEEKSKEEKLPDVKNMAIASDGHKECFSDVSEPATITVIDETSESEIDKKTGNRAGRLIINNIKNKLRNNNIKRHTSSSSVASIQLHASSRSPSPEEKNLNNPAQSSGGRIAYKTQSMSSLQVPGHLSTSNPWDPTKEEDTLSIGSRRPSVDSVSRKSVDYRIRNTTMVIQPNSDEKPKSVFTSDETYIQNAVPCLPMGLAVTCLILNVVLPGSGTALSGLSILCCGHTRLSNKEDQLLNSLCANILVGIAQLFTVSFLLVGWFWSISWGIKMVSVSVRHREELKQQREKDLQALALSAFGSPKRVNLFGS